MSEPIGTLYTVPIQPPGKVIRAIAAYTHQTVTIPSDYVHFDSNKKPEFLAKFPHGKIPAFEGKDGFKVFESVAIARYVAALAPKYNLLGSNIKEAALVDQWINFASHEIGVPLYTLRSLLNHNIPYNKVAETKAREAIIRSLTTLNAHLTKNTFVAYHRLSVADFFLAASLTSAFATILDGHLRQELPNLQRYYETVINQAGVKEIFGEPTYVEKALQWTPPPKEEKKHHEEKKHEKKEEKHEKKEEKKKEEKPKKKAEDDDDDEEEEPSHHEPKAKNPLDDLPKSAFNLEDWKRAYSNMDTRGKGGSLEWFYEKFDKEGFSIWRVDFKYNSELTQVFMSSNQIGGFFNRLEGSRKYLFGSMGVLGTANNSIISGVLILRGKDFKPVIEVAPDWESYTYAPLHVVGDQVNADEKAFFEAALAWDLEIDGKKWADGKNFK